MQYYFAFGSNLSARRVRHRIGWSPSRIGAVLADYRLTFDKQSEDGGKANIQPSSGDEVEGIIYYFEEKDFEIMDGFEGVEDGQYQHCDVNVKVATGHLVPAIAYVALNIGPETKPTQEYLNYILEGEHLLSPEYVINLEEIATI